MMHVSACLHDWATRATSPSHTQLRASLRSPQCDSDLVKECVLLEQANQGMCAGNRDSGHVCNELETALSTIISQMTYVYYGPYPTIYTARRVGLETALFWHMNTRLGLETGRIT